MPGDIDLSIVTPALNEADNLEELLQRVAKAVQGHSYEIIIVDDCSTDATYAKACELGQQLGRVRVLRLSRTFGHQAALEAGLRAARGRAIISLDADLQHPPEIIPKLIDAWKAGHNVVHTVRTDSRSTGGLFKRISSRLFYWLFKRQSGLAIRPGMADFRLVDRTALDHVLAAGDHGLFFRGMFVWVGLSQTHITYEPQKRRVGRSHYSWRKMVRFGATGLVAFSEAPLYWALGIGGLFSTASIAYAIYAVIMWRFNNQTVPGWASLAVLISFLMGVQFILLGLVGAYIGAIYREVKGRPAYIIAQDSAADPSDV